ncbi:MAG: META domain-containing protein [Methylotetracoccus sp.]
MTEKRIGHSRPHASPRPPVSALLFALTTMACAAVEPAGTSRLRSPEAVIGVEWHLEEYTTPSERVLIDKPDRYTLQLDPDGHVSAQFDCNRGGGDYRIEPGKLQLTGLVSTRMGCPPESFGDRYAGELSRVTGFFVEAGRLYLELPEAGSTLRFARAR